MAELTEKAIQEIVKLARAGSLPITIEGGNTPIAVIPSDMKVVGLGDFVHNERSERPLRKSGTVKVLDGESFLEYWSLFSDENSRVFADEEKETILAVLDYHGAGTEGGPRWGNHRIELTLKKSREWLIWKAQSGKKVTQMDFAEFLEDNVPDIVDPSAASMLEVARDMKAKIDADFGSSFTASNGAVHFKYSETVKATFGNGTIDVPEQFKIAIPVHVGGDRVTITARLRFRIVSGKLSLWFDLLRAEEVEHKAFLQIQSQIKSGISCRIINGSPA